jgi:hypothetical protein
MAHSIDVSKAYRATATETGLYLDTSRIQSDLTVDIIITYKNYAGEQTVDIGSKQTLESVVGLFMQVVVDGKATYRFPVLKTVAPGTTVTLDLDQNSLAASFTNLAGAPDKVTLVKQKEVNLEAKGGAPINPGLFLTQAHLRNGLTAPIVITVDEVTFERNYRIDAGQSLYSLDGTFTGLVVAGGIFQFNVSYEVKAQSTVLIGLNWRGITATFEDIEGRIHTVELV